MIYIQCQFISLFSVVSDEGSTPEDQWYKFNTTEIFNDDKCDDHSKGNYWHGVHQNTPISFFVIDLEVVIFINNIILRNSYNAPHRDR